MRSKTQYDFVVVGAGLAGMMAMARLSSSGFQVLGLERQSEAPLDSADLRSTALLMPAIECLRASGLWEELQTQAAPLNMMEIVDANQTPPQSARFEASEIGQEQFGYNFLNKDLHATLREFLKSRKNVVLKFESELQKLMSFERHMELKVNGELCHTRALIAADGRNSRTRQMLGIDADFKPIDQMAQVFIAQHEHPHHNISTEVHSTSGPFTLVPMHDVKGKPASAVVWMDQPEAVNAREKMTVAEFNTALNARSFGVRGKLERIGGLGAFPMMLMEARRFSEGRGVLIGEAAHIVPPIGAQGLNMSLRDIESLVRAAERGALEDVNILHQWGRKRQMDVKIRTEGIRWLNQISIGGNDRILQMRRFGLEQLTKNKPLRKGLMRLGLGQ